MVHKADLFIPLQMAVFDFYCTFHTVFYDTFTLAYSKLYKYLFIINMADYSLFGNWVHF